MSMSNLSNFLNIDNIQRRIGGRFNKNQSGFVINGFFNVFWNGGIHFPGFNAPIG